MAVRFDAAGDALSRSTSPPNVRAFTVCGWANAIVDNGAVAQLLVSMLDAGFTDGIALYWDNGFGNFEVIVADGGAIFDNAVVSASPATGTPFAWFVSCSGNGTNTVTAGYRLASDNTWTTGTADMNAVVADNTAINFASVAGGQDFNGRLWNIKAWDRALSQAEILAESFYEKVQFPASLNFHWPLHRHDALVDWSGNGRTPTTGGTLATEDGEYGLWKPDPLVLLHVPDAAPSVIATAFQPNVFQSTAFQIYGADFSGGVSSISGTTSFAFTPTGTITGAGSLAGTVSFAFTTGPRVLSGAGALAGATALTFTTAGAVTGSGALAGTSALTFTPTGTVTGAGALAGTSSPSFTTAGALTGGGALAGTSSFAFTTAGDLTNLGSGDIAGTSTPAFSLSGALTGSGALAATSALAFTTSGALTASGALAGSSPLTFTTAGAVTGAGALAGTSSPAFTTSATLTAEGALAGTSSPAFTTAGDLTGLAAGDISGTASLAFSVSGTLTGEGALAGTAGMIFVPAGTLTPPQQTQEATGGWPTWHQLPRKRKVPEQEYERLRALEEAEEERERALARARSEKARQKERERLEKARAARIAQERLIELMAAELAALMRDAEAQEMAAMLAARTAEEDEAILLMLAM